MSFSVELTLPPHYLHYHKCGKGFQTLDTDTMKSSLSASSRQNTLFSEESVFLYKRVANFLITAVLLVTVFIIRVSLNKFTFIYSWRVFYICNKFFKIINFCDKGIIQWAGFKPNSITTANTANPKRSAENLPFTASSSSSELCSSLTYHDVSFKFQKSSWIFHKQTHKKAI